MDIVEYHQYHHVPFYCEQRRSSLVATILYPMHLISYHFQFDLFL